MSPAVEAALIAGGVGVLTLAGTMFSQFYGIRRTSSNTEKILKQQTEHLDTTLAQQREQLDRTLAQQCDRTLNERSATAADRLGSDKPPFDFRRGLGPRRTELPDRAAADRRSKNQDRRADRRISRGCIATWSSLLVTKWGFLGARCRIPGGGSLPARAVTADITASSRVFALRVAVQPVRLPVSIWACGAHNQ